MLLQSVGAVAMDADLRGSGMGIAAVEARRGRREKRLGTPQEISVPSPWHWYRDREGAVSRIGDLHRSLTVAVLEQVFPREFLKRRGEESIMSKLAGEKSAYGLTTACCGRRGIGASDRK